MTLDDAALDLDGLIETIALARSQGTNSWGASEVFVIGLNAIEDLVERLKAAEAREEIAIGQRDAAQHWHEDAKARAEAAEQRVADAWDEGHLDVCNDCVCRNRNPYRSGT